MTKTETRIAYAAIVFGAVFAVLSGITAALQIFVLLANAG